MKRLLYLAIIILLFTPYSAFAEITSPYTVDEKSRVLFGDSTEVDGHHGLENYSYDYVEGYLHINFSYTHHGCCTASYPPVLYVTDRDPRATTTAVVRDRTYVYPLNTQPVHRTDVYFYDVQFEPTGYTVRVNASTTDFTWVYVATTTEVTNFHREIPGLMQSDWVALANDFPLNAVLEGENPNSMSFAPVPIYEQTVPTPVVATTTPVIIVPGIMGSYLEKNGVELWLSLVQLSTSITDVHLLDLILAESGNSLDSSIVATDIIRSVNIALFKKDNFFGLIETLKENGYQENQDLFVFPYDWRLDIEVLALLLKDRIDQVKLQRGVEDVNIISHSMGGLIMKKYLRDYGGTSVDKFIDAGTPHSGSSKSFMTLMYGNTDIAIANKGAIKSISQNMPSVYQLLPSENYFDEADPDYRYYVWNGINGNSRLSYEETKSYMAANGRNELLLDRANELHQEIDNLNPGDYGVETYNFVGCGVPTIGQFYILGEKNGKYIYNIKMINGDGTVPIKSAEAMQASSTIYVKGIQHAIMPSAPGVKDVIAAILSATSTENLDVSHYSNLSLSSSGCIIPNGKIVSFHSPIELHIYDPDGNHTGPNADGDIENNIDGVVYEVIDGNKFAFLPSGTQYTVRGSATDTGSFDVRIQEVVEGEVATTTLYLDLPLTMTTQALFEVGDIVPSQVELDHEKDGVYELSFAMSTSTQGIIESMGEVGVGGVPEDIVNENAGVGSSSFGSSRVEKKEDPPTETTVEEVQSLENPVILDAVPLSQNSPTQQEDQTKEMEKIEEEMLEEDQYENAAIVYKSFGYKILNLFKKIWSWLLNIF